MKKAILILVCCTMLVLTISCNANDNSVHQTDTSSQKEFAPVTSETSQLNPEPYSNLTKKASIWRDKEGELYIYIKEWDVYRYMPNLSSYNSLYFNDNCIVVDSETATVSVIHQYGKNDEPTIITYHFNRNDENVQSHSVKLNIKASSEHDTFFVNMHDSDHGYYFLTPNMDGFADKRMSGVHEWPLFMFETTDGGKSWNQISTNVLDPNTSDYINIFKFISPQVGILSFRDLGAVELFDRTYLTVDGGLTWNHISQLPHSEMVKWYSEVIDLEYIDDRYYLKVKCYGDAEKKELRFCSEDLINWSLN